MVTVIVLGIITSYLTAALFSARSWWREWRCHQASIGMVGKSRYVDIYGNCMSWRARCIWVVVISITVAILCWWGVGIIRLLWAFMTRNAPLSDNEKEAIRKKQERELREKEEREERELRAKEEAAGIRRLGE